MIMRRSILFLGLGLVGIAFSATTMAVEISESFRREVLADLDRVEKDGPRMSEMMAAMREAGSSYLPEIVAPADADKYQDPERRRMMNGVYLMDLTYASTFYQNEASARYGMAVARLIEQLGFPDPDFEREYREALEQIDQPGGEERLQALVRKTEYDTAWQDMMTTSEGMDVVIDAFYGFLIEALYLTAEITVLSDYNPAFMQYINDIRESFLIYRQALIKFEQYPELAEIVEKNQRIEFIANLLNTLGDLESFDREDVDRLRPIVTKARTEIVR